MDELIQLEQLGAWPLVGVVACLESDGALQTQRKWSEFVQELAPPKSWAEIEER